MNGCISSGPVRTTRDWVDESLIARHFCIAAYARPEASTFCSRSSGQALHKRLMCIPAHKLVSILGPYPRFVKSAREPVLCPDATMIFRPILFCCMILCWLKSLIFFLSLSFCWKAVPLPYGKVASHFVYLVHMSDDTICMDVQWQNWDFLSALAACQPCDHPHS